MSVHFVLLIFTAHNTYFIFYYVYHSNCLFNCYHLIKLKYIMLFTPVSIILILSSVDYYDNSNWLINNKPQTWSLREFIRICGVINRLLVLVVNWCIGRVNDSTDDSIRGNKIFGIRLLNLTDHHQSIVVVNAKLEKIIM